MKADTVTRSMLVRLTIGGGAAFWATTIATSLLPIAAEYRAAYSNWSVQAVWVGSLFVGMIIAGCVSYSFLRLLAVAPTEHPIQRSATLGFVALVIVTVLIDVPRSLLASGPSDALRYFVIGVMFNAARFLVLGAVIGHFYGRMHGSIESVLDIHP